MKLIDTEETFSFSASKTKKCQGVQSFSPRQPNKKHNTNRSEIIGRFDLQSVIDQRDCKVYRSCPWDEGLLMEDIPNEVQYL